MIRYLSQAIIVAICAFFISKGKLSILEAIVIGLVSMLTLATIDKFDAIQRHKLDEAIMRPQYGGSSICHQLLNQPVQSYSTNDCLQIYKYFVANPLQYINNARNHSIFKYCNEQLNLTQTQKPEKKV